MSDQLVNVLKARLAAGEISIAEYRSLLAEIGEDRSSPPSTEAPQYETGTLLGEFEQFRLFEYGVQVGQQFHPMSQVVSVKGGQSYKSFNFVPSQNRSSFSITFLSGEQASAVEDRLVFGGKRHNALIHFYDAVRQLTFKPRLTNLVSRLSDIGHLDIYKPPFGGEDTVVLRKDGVIVAGTRTVNLKTAKATGTFGLGTQWHALNAVSQKTNPAEVVMSEERGLLGTLIPRAALRFTPYPDDVDVVHALLGWLAEPSNHLK
ncbi:hypothetical protein [Piscinibacter terrae]|uniref:Uncharacterized protein n=1 Tax=Piscinibacter terrae TaxID=2496871 RepID=A0A3N7HIK4_9BURK|nr:hypothetical protein [Albitalea terrae]RQP21867.1 hypothetical protein DZC73_25855 [Albitalea terrae]